MAQYFASADSIEVSAGQPLPVDSLATGIDSLSIVATKELLISKDTLDAPIKYEARDSIIYDLISQKVYLYGAASMTQKDLRLDAGFIILDQVTKTLVAFPATDTLGNKIERPVFKDGEQQFSSDEIAYNFETKRGRVSHLVTQQGEGYLVGDKVKKEENNDLYAYNAYYTTCDLEHPHFKITSKKVKVIPNHLIVTGPANLVIADIPTPLVLPFGIFPINKDRQSGILLPTYGESSNLGFYFRDGGFYLGFSDYMDLALRGDIYTKGSWRLSAASTYAKRYRFRGNVNLQYASNKFGDPLEVSYKRSKDFRINWNHSQDPKSWPNSGFGAKVTFGTSTFDQNSYHPNQNYLTNSYNSSVSYSHRFANTPFHLSTALNHEMNTSTRIQVLTLPNISFSMDRVNPFKRKKQIGSARWYEAIYITYVSNYKNIIRAPDSLFFSKNITDYMKYGASHNTTVSSSHKILKYLNLTPSVTIAQKWYLDEIYRFWDTSTPIIDSTLNIEGDILAIDTTYGQVREVQKRGFNAPTDLTASLAFNTSLFGVLNFKTPRIKAFRHVLRPSVSLNWTPDYTNFWGHYYYRVQSAALQDPADYAWYSPYEKGIFGGPPRGNVFGLSYSLGNNFELKRKVKNDTSEVFQIIKLLDALNLSSGYNFIADSFKMTRITMTGSTRLLDLINITFSAGMDPYGNNSSGRRIDTYAIKNGQGLFRFDQARFNTSFTLPFAKKKEMNNSSDPANSFRSSEDKMTGMMAAIMTEDSIPLPNLSHYRGDYVDFRIPWSLSIDYALNFTKIYNPALRLLNIIQTLNFRGDISLTPKWKLAINSGYDFKAKALAPTRVNITRDLHCWEMSFNWIPNGRYQSYDFVIRVKSDMLKDLKLQRRRTWVDYEN